MSQISNLLSTKIRAKSDLIESWFGDKFSIYKPNFYNSIDLRHSGFKIAPIDTNCFPAGFNNLSQFSKEQAKELAKKFFELHFPHAKKILILPESHTRNINYLYNILSLQEILQTEENQVVIGSLIEDIEDILEINLENNQKITLHKLTREGDFVKTHDNFVADVIILNNDLTEGVPKIIENVKNAIIPSVNLGWYNRAKSNHFTIYNDLAREFAEILDIDSWLISSLHKNCENVDFKERVGIECLAKSVDELLLNLKEKYKEYGVSEDPYCYIKADNGTYGMAVMPIFSADEILDINKKNRNKMNMLKGNVQNKMIIIQEGIKTIDLIDNKIAEPMIYMIAGKVAGNLFRVNQTRNSLESLNSSGAEFFDLNNIHHNKINFNQEDFSLIYSLISRLAALATSIENENAKK